MKIEHKSSAVSIVRWSSLIVMLIMLLSLAVTQPVQAQPHALGVTRYVSPAGSDDLSNDCTNPSTPCLTIQASIDRANSDDIIYAALGTYTGAGEQVANITKNITLQGGWDTGFISQSGTSIIDGGEVRRGITVQAGLTVLIDHFTVQNGYHISQGAGLSNAGTLNLSRTVFSNNWSRWRGGAIYNTGTLTVIESTISGNTTGQESHGSGLNSWGGAGIENDGGTVTINSSTLSGNNILGEYHGSAIENRGGLTITNSTITGNTPFEAIFQYSGSVSINSSTITDNPGSGAWIMGGTATMSNTILARNTSGAAPECYGNITSAGYNILGLLSNEYGSCGFSSSTGDLVGTAVSPINPRLARLSDNGGPTQTRALSDSSPARNAGNPAVCPSTDQRGVTRAMSVEDPCDIGAYEGSVTLVNSITRVNGSPTSAPTVSFTVTFSSPVTGLDKVAPFNDFRLTTTGLTGAKVREVTGSGATYTVKVFTGTGNGTLRLDLKDLDTIKNGSDMPLGGPGLSNGSFKGGQVYTITKITKAISPGGLMWDNTPTFTWTKVPRATQYSLQLMKGATVMYNKIVGSGVCTGARCSTTPGTLLSAGGYKWRVKAMSYGSWKPYNGYKSFSIDKPKPGSWVGGVPTFYVSPEGASVLNFTVSVNCGGGVHYITHPSVAIVSRSFSFGGTFQANGAFLSPTSASGTAKLNSYLIPACGAYVSTPLTNWTASWQSDAQPGIVLAVPNDPSMKYLLDPAQVLLGWLNGDPDPVNP